MRRIGAAAAFERRTVRTPRSDAVSSEVTAGSAGAPSRRSAEAPGAVRPTTHDGRDGRDHPLLRHVTGSTITNTDGGEGMRVQHAAGVPVTRFVLASMTVTALAIGEVGARRAKPRIESGAGEATSVARSAREDGVATATSMRELDTGRAAACPRNKSGAGRTAIRGDDDAARETLRFRQRCSSREYPAGAHGRRGSR